MAAKNSGIEIRDLCKMFAIGNVQACKYVNLEIVEGEFMVLLGPSGCGKTTTLRCVAGLERPDNDDAIWLKGRNITTLPPKDRHLAFVFQDTMLFPHLAVRKNISFGLDMRKTMDKGEIDRRVQEAARLLHVEPVLDRKPSQLSGGQAQRVALGRAIVMEPDAFLMDEPLANLDAALRVEMRTEIKRVQRRLSTSTIFVTHDQEEALSLGDKIAVMNEGAVQQVGSPHEIYHDPANMFVGTFIGSPPLNLFDGNLQTEGGQTLVVTELFRLGVPDGLMKNPSQAARNVRLGIRPEFVTIGPEKEGAFPAQVTLIEPLGSRTLIFLQVNDREIRSMVQGESPVKEGEAVHVTFEMERAFLFDSEGERV
jgi:multiple sugar transport system ATP-binding protein